MKQDSKLCNDAVFQLVEDMLTHTRKRNDNAALAATLKDRYGSAYAFFRSNAHQMETCGLHRHDALLFSRVFDLARHVERAKFVKHPQLGRLPLASEYLLATFFQLQLERFYMLCLDSRGRLKECVFLQEGTNDGALFSLRLLLREIMRVQPHAVVLSHNHPRGTLRPSQDDINCTQDAMQALSAVGVPLLDHIIIARKQAVSLRDNGFIPAVQWRRQAPENKLLNNWLSMENFPKANNYRPGPGKK